jgi:Cd2+/Zn2+-exporting ATPase
MEAKTTCHSGCGCSCGHNKEEERPNVALPVLSFILLVAGLILDHTGQGWFSPAVKLVWYLAAFLPVGLPVMREAYCEARQKDFFTEFTLMSVTSIGAFSIGEYPEAVAVMLFYTVGEMLQNRAVERASQNISRLLDVRPERTDVFREGKYINVSPKEVQAGEGIEVKPGGRIPLDGILQESEASFDTSALTGESMPRTLRKGDEVLAGMIVLGQAVRIEVNRPYEQSALARILALVKDAAERKAPAELFIRRFARFYTPAVLALLIVTVPALAGLMMPSFQYVFHDWLYRGLVFLVISCPCALVISVPLGYFGGIGAASRAGILFKGGNYLDAITRINTVAFDKTGTLTTGRFDVTDMQAHGIPGPELLALLLSVEQKSTHPIAQAIVRYAKKQNISAANISKMHELAGHGVEAVIGGQEVLVGNIRLMKERGISIPEELSDKVATVVICAIGKKYAGHLLLSDTLKDDAVRRLPN